VSERHHIDAVLHQKTVAIETKLVYQIILFDVMRTLNSIATKGSAAIYRYYANFIIATPSDVTGNHAAFHW
jgi:hypothetical protein